MDSLIVNGVTYWLPNDNNDVIALVNEAKANNEIICLRGAAHSFPIIRILEKGPTSGKPYKYVMLSKMNQVTINTQNSTAVVQGGCHLGLDPWDPTGTSTLENSLVYQLSQQGLALSDLGGITHQTVAGFLATGSSGGSPQYSFEGDLIGIDIITCENGAATLKTFNRPVPENLDDPFYGAGTASMGLFGVIVAATFKCIPNFYVIGDEATSFAKVTDCEVDLFGSGGAKPSLETFLQQTEYTRLMWWPQKNVEKMVVWKASRTDEAGAAAWAKQAYEKIGKPVLPLKPYEEVPYIFGSPSLATLGADAMYSAIGNWPNWLLDLLGDTTEYKVIKDMVDTLFYPVILPKLLDVFVTNDQPYDPQKKAGGPQEFADVWYNGLPMDNQMSDKLMPVWFTELWIPIGESQKVMNVMKDFYEKSNENTGAFSCEIYASKSNSFWLSPSYNTDVIRIDIFWFGNNSGNPMDFYQKFWTLLQPFNFRPHWAKYLPSGTGAQGVAYLKSNYPKWENWMALRQQLDPDQVFVNDYWRLQLNIPNN